MVGPEVPKWNFGGKLGSFKNHDSLQCLLEKNVSFLSFLPLIGKKRLGEILTCSKSEPVENKDPFQANALPGSTEFLSNNY